MSMVRIGMIGIGGMGSSHAQRIAAGEVPGAELAAVCDIDPQRLAWARENLDPDMPCFCEHLRKEEDFATNFSRLHALCADLGVSFLRRDSNPGSALKS